MGFEAMPQIADLEIAATWDEIELEAALKGGAEAADQSSATTASALADALRAVDELKRLPKEERKQRAEELLRALTSAPAAQSRVPEAGIGGEAASGSEDPPAAEASPSPEPVSVAADFSPQPEEEPTKSEPALDATEIANPITQAPRDAETTQAEAASALPESVEPVAIEAVPPPPNAIPGPESAPPVTNLCEPSVEESAGAEIVSADVAPIVPERAEPVMAVSVDDPHAAAEPASAANASAVADPTPDAAASMPIVEPVPEAAPVPEIAPEPVTAVVVTAEPDAIPKFLTTECAALDPEQPDSLIPLRTAAAAGALIGAVLLIYFGSSQEFGVAARPIFAASEIARTPGADPKVPASLGARQAFVALPPNFATGPESVRPHRPPLVGFDLFDDAAPPAAIAAKADASQAPASSPAPLVVPPSAAEKTAALPPPLGSDAAALIKRGDDLLKAGDIAAARSAYERAAAQGSTKAQIGVGKTYDPLVLAKLGARGVRGDPVQAASWYARAGEAGDEEGQQRLHALISGLSDCMLGQGNCANRKP